ncbi:MAG TPA: acetyl-CoA carboxylase carboxyltransferase subunit alpha [Candidatus Krumholzibacteria bacterium]|nr:acetyl-CoA carboxylase carboxyltransferase subunit alpha [Candidatus Krumholzibacteria bacterium]HPD71439.1 acetyl-CoA carboxylase carboxyltransferase subunit alpha [Candidatus Krumholzibacteria bacterium]HRY41628.1 acetyl-CoA carboxylase carboxyltransferase subunit alpha [Candidatus Krumholzibacteria bacterium]
MPETTKGPWLDFERPIVELEERIRTLEASAAVGGVDVADEVAHLRRKAVRLSDDIFSKLEPWQRVQLARHGRRPTTLDLIERIFTQFVPLHGDRQFRDDPAIVGGLARLEGRPVLVLGHQKGRDTRSNVQRNFGMAHPEGYRKALRLMTLAERFERPIITFIDTPGAYPGLGAEERGQAEAIAHNLRAMAALRVPTVAVVTGEGGSGGALALGVADRIYMLENAVYSVISPEGCAAILWRDAAKAPDAAKAMRLTAADAFRHTLIDGIVGEPVGGAHRDHAAAALAVKAQLLDALAELVALDQKTLRERRLAKYLAMGEWTERR